MLDSFGSTVIAALDLGSNTFRLVLADDGGYPVNKRVFQYVPRLGEHLEAGGRFSVAALDRAWEALDGLAVRIKEAGAQKVLAGATMAVRLAADGVEFMRALEERYGWEAVILTGDEEARLTAAGVISGLEAAPAQGLIFDIGGRSTEFIEVRGVEIYSSLSLAMGVTALTEVHLSDPVVAGELEAVAAEARVVLASAELGSVPVETVLVGTAGTVTTLAAMLLGLKEYRPELVNGVILKRVDLVTLLSSLAVETVEERVSRYGLHPRRADVIVSGLVVVLEIMALLGREEILVSDNGLLEGLWLWYVGAVELDSRQLKNAGQ